jgi:beta-galactosidase
MSERQTFPLLDGWQCNSSGAWSEVSLPHTFNAVDGARGGAYFRGPVRYRRRLPRISEDQRCFLHFEGACLTSTVRLGGRELGVHRGGYTGFYVEVPASEEWLEVEVNNARQEEVIPLAGDFTIFGGIYRPVHCVLAPKTCFTPTACGSDGVRILNQWVGDGVAEILWSAHITAPGMKDCDVWLTVRDEEGALVAEQLAPGNSGTENEILLERTITLNKPVLWQGRKRPHQYQFCWQLMERGICLDRLERKIGIRSLTRNEHGGLLLNGEAITLRGVCKHQDTAGKATAVSQQDLERDLGFVMELGANAVRLAHYPHAQATYDLCDRLGLLVWTEIPLVNELCKTGEFRRSTLGQLREMISQLSHHASIFCWGIFNELYSPQSERWPELIEELHAGARMLDPSRFTACAGNMDTPVELRNITDLLATNAYPGWYHSRPDDMASRITEWNLDGGNRGLGVSEYGAGGNPWQHDEPPSGPYPTEGFWHPEEWQNFCHERQYECIRQSPVTWGSFVWVLFDFYSDRRNEGGVPGINNKGMVSVDRAVKKDVFHFYKAHWSESPVLHITSKRNYKPRPAPRTLRVYTNCAELKATLDGAALGESRRAFGVVVEFDLPALGAGEHVFQVAGGTVSDERRFVI